MTNVSCMILSTLVMLLWITNLSVINDISHTGWTALWSDTISNWNVQLLLGMISHYHPFQHIRHDTIIKICSVYLSQYSVIISLWYDDSYRCRAQSKSQMCLIFMNDPMEHPINDTLLQLWEHKYSRLLLRYTQTCVPTFRWIGGDLNP